ncbi:cyclin-dependent kinase 4 inhibitor B-like [Menidia menidia]|uniref:(Atlantic silverside) hypothetical protein n=1 Tax=Menidia menidia TaxID=238744 RepID=A0A8S4BR38_9TELE|nr:unnamed protein product [Menidia menidia]
MDVTLNDKLSAASANGDVSAVLGLLRAGASVNGTNSFGRTAVQVMMMGSTPVARALLRHGAEPRAADPSTGATPLHDAAGAGFLDTVRLLLQHRADPRARDHANRLPADVARKNKHDKVAAFLESL